MEVSVSGIFTYPIPYSGYQGYRATKSVSEKHFLFSNFHVSSIEMEWIQFIEWKSYGT